MNYPVDDVYVCGRIEFPHKPSGIQVLLWMDEGFMSLRGVEVNLDT